MRKLFREAAFIVSCVGCFISVGCVAVPTSEISFGNARARLPKDSEATELEIQVQSGTNKLVFKAKGWSTKNNPAVISASTDQIKAHYAGAEGVVKTAIEAAEKGAVKAVVPIP